MTYFCSIGSQILYIFETHGIGQTPSSLERYLVVCKILVKMPLCATLVNTNTHGDEQPDFDQLYY